MLEVKDLTVVYGTHTVIDDLSFRIEEGQWLMVVGPNGAGKSTVLNAVTQGAPYTGSILLNGTDIKRQKPSARARQIGVLAQNHHVSYDFTVEEIVRLGRYAYASGLFSGSGDGDEGAVEYAMELTGMTPKRNQSVLTLSGGELQRTFLAQVLAQNPRLLLLDEPTNHLDLVYQKQIFALIGQWLKTPGRAVLSVVHDLSLARAFGTDALLMHKGKAVAQGKTGAVLSPETLDPVYGMDVYEWMRTMLSQWSLEE
ncbi:MAG: ABC transporter ATP-binding protein [Lachnospiraceae bacterium]|nr:ABC transporter ATP-binding protein [Lachnospiraceae bacterium]